MIPDKTASITMVIMGARRGFTISWTFPPTLGGRKRFVEGTPQSSPAEEMAKALKKAFYITSTRISVVLRNLLLSSLFVADISLSELKAVI